MPVRLPRRLLALAASAATVIGLGACGSKAKDANPGGSVLGDGMTVYSSLPLRGPFAERNRAMVNGEKLALSDSGGIVGRWTIKYASLDDAVGPTGSDAAATADNARTAAQDTSTIAYLGDADFPATAISLPILNQAGVAQVSPASSYTGFTRPGAGTGKGEPDKYQPSGIPTFARVVPSDAAEGLAQARYQSAEGCRSTFIIDDAEVEGRSPAAAVAQALPSAGIKLAGTGSANLGDADQSALGRQVREAGADCVFVGAGPAAAPSLLWRALHQAVPQARLFGPADLARPLFLAGLSPAEQAVTRLTRPTLPDSALGAQARDVLRRYRERFGRPAPQEMLYGYEAMALVLATLRRAGDRANKRTYVARLLRQTTDRMSVLGRYSIRPDGDTTLRRFSGYRVRGGEPVFDRVLLNG